MAIFSGWPAQARVMSRTWSRLLLLTLVLVPPGYVAATALKPMLFNNGKQLLIKTSSQEGEFNYKRASDCREDERCPRKLFTLLLQNYFEVIYYRKKKKKHTKKESLFSGLRNAEHQCKGKTSTETENLYSSFLPPPSHPSSWSLSLNMFH